MPDPPPRNYIEKFMQSVQDTIEGPVVWFREKIVEPNRKQYPWYHQKFRRVPTIDQCDTDDPVCYFEANEQYKRDRLVDNEVLSILRSRYEHCTLYEAPDHIEKCQDLYKTYKEASTNWFIKYGDMGAYHNVQTAYMKQKHRLIWERRHGPVGGGVKSTSEE